VAVCPVNGRIFWIGGGVPSAHDLRIYHKGGLLEAIPDELGIGDKGYQGGRRLLTPAKKKKSVELTEDEDMMNRLIATVRINVERTIGRLKVFHCIGTRWRSAWEMHPNAFFVIAQMVNLSFDVNPLVKTPHEIFKIVPQDAAQLAIQERLAPIIHNQQ
jgi:hypothetical protein